MCDPAAADAAMYGVLALSGVGGLVWIRDQLRRYHRRLTATDEPASD